MTTTEKQNAQLVIVTGFVILYILFKSASLLYISAALGIVFLFVPVVGNIIITGWYKLSEILGWLSSRIILSVVFYLFLFPIASLSKLFSRDPLNRRNSESSLFSERNHKYQKEDLENVW